MHVCTAEQLCVHEREFLSTFAATRLFLLEEQDFWEEMFERDCFLNSCPCCARAKQLMKHVSIHPRKSSACAGFFFFLLLPLLHFLLLLLLEFIFCSLRRASEKRSHRQQIEIADIHISAEPSLDLSPNILSVSICLQFFKRSFPPSLPPFVLLCSYWVSEL